MFLDAWLESLLWMRHYPWLILLAFALPLVALAWTKQVYPHRAFVVLALAPAGLAGLLLVWQDLVLLVGLADVAVLTLAALDLASLPRRRHFSVERTVGRIVSLGMPHRVSLVVNNHSRGAYHLDVRDDTPAQFHREPAELTLHLTSHSRATLHYDIRSQRRGAFRLECVYLRTRSALGLWRRHLVYPCQSTVHVYPDMKQLAEYAVLARTNRLSLMGLRRTRRIGQDNEFERLRDYTLDDNFKYIDWRATARRNKLTVKDFQTNQSQRLIFLIDCGRMMTNQAAGWSLLDHAFNSMLMLSFVALRQGDAVGLICFSDQIHNYVPPRGGMAQMNRLLHACFDRFPTLVESRYDEAFLYLSSHCQKRSLVVLISNLIDEVNSHQVRQYLGNLVGRHLPLGVLLRDRRIFEFADEGFPHYRNHAQLCRSAAAAEILIWRRQLLRDLEQQGVLNLDVFPEDLTAPLVNRYLDIKARHLL